MRLDVRRIVLHFVISYAQWCASWRKPSYGILGIGCWSAFVGAFTDGDRGYQSNFSRPSPNEAEPPSPAPERGFLRKNRIFKT